MESLKQSVNNATKLEELNNIYLPNPTKERRQQAITAFANKVTELPEFDEILEEIESYQFEFDTDLNDAICTISNEHNFKGLLRAAVHYAASFILSYYQ